MSFYFHPEWSWPKFLSYKAVRAKSLVSKENTTIKYHNLYYYILHRLGTTNFLGSGPGFVFIYNF